MNIFKKVFHLNNVRDEVIKVLNERLKETCNQLSDTEQKLATSRKLYSMEKDRADKAVEGAALMADQNAFLRDAMMRMIEKGKAGATDAG